MFEGVLVAVKSVNWGKWLLYVIMVGLLVNPQTRILLMWVLRDAYLSVVVFVAATLALFYILEDWLGLDVAGLLQRYSRVQPVIAAVAGALPGCGGAIVVVTQYVKGGISFGALVAVLISTMGDAAFLLLARKPLVALGLFAGSIVVGSISGMLVDAIHGPDFLRSKKTGKLLCHKHRNLVAPMSLFGWAWMLILIPGVVLGLADAFQLDADALLGIEGFSPRLVVGVFGASLSLMMWDILPLQKTPSEPHCCHAHRELVVKWKYGSTISRIANDTNFVTKWIVLAFLLYELALFFSGVQLEQFFSLWAPLVPLMGIVLGFIPGCGPQVVVTTLYVNGLIPFSAQLGNAICNDGDALFPALAVAPKASLVATVYSAVPAVLLAYGWYWLFE